MKISVDGGALCTAPDKRFGTYNFSVNILKAFAEYDVKNKYDVYGFCDTSKLFSKNFSEHINYKLLKPSTAWMQLRVPIEEYINRHDIFLALNQAIPAYTPARIFAWSHGLAYLDYPNLYSDSQSSLKRQLLTMASRAERIFVTSERVKEQIIQFTNSTPVHIVPIGVPYDMPYSPLKKRMPFFMFVGMNHPIKNIQFIIDSFNIFVSQKQYSHFTLAIVSDSLDGLTGINDSIHLVRCGRTELRSLYRSATALLSASHYESFNLPILEALSQGCPVVALESAVIPEMKSNVLSAQSQEEYIQKMNKSITIKSNPKTVKQIRTEFSWEGIVQSIRMHY